MFRISADGLIKLLRTFFYLESYDQLLALSLYSPPAPKYFQPPKIRPNDQSLI